MTYEPFEKIPDPNAKQGQEFERLDPGTDYEKVTSDGTADPAPGVQTEGERATKAMGDAFATIYDRLKANISLSTTEFVDDVSNNPMVRGLWRAGGTALDYLDRGQGALVAGQRILVAAAKGENTADMLTPWEILAKYDLRDVTDQQREQYQREMEEWKELPDEAKVTLPRPKKPGRAITERGGEDGIPGQKELLETTLGEERVELLESTPFMLGDKPMTKDNLWRLATLRNMVATTPDAESDVILTQGEFLRGVMNVVNDPWIPLEFVSMPAKGVRGVRHFLIDPNYRQVGAQVDDAVASALTNVDEAAFGLMKYDIGLQNATTDGEMMSLTSQMFADFQLGKQNNLPQIFRALSDKVAQIDPNTLDEAAKAGGSMTLIDFTRWLMGIDANLTHYDIIEDFTEPLYGGGIREGVQFEARKLVEPGSLKEGLARVAGDRNFQEFVSRVENLVFRMDDKTLTKFKSHLVEMAPYSRSYMEETGQLPFGFLHTRRAHIGDAFEPSGLTFRPTLMTDDGRILYVQTTGKEMGGFRGNRETDAGLAEQVASDLQGLGSAAKGETVQSSLYPEYDDATQGIYYMATGNKMDVVNPTNEAMTVRTLVTENEDTGRTSLLYEFRVPDATEEHPGIRENLIDHLEQFLLNLGPGLQAQRNQMKIDTRNHIRLQMEKAEQAVYQSLGFTASPEIPEMVQRRKILQQGRRFTQGGTSVPNPQREAAKKLVKKARAAAEKKASNEAAARAASTNFEPRFYINIGHPDPKTQSKRIRTTVEIDRGDITKMLSYNRSLRDIINLKAPVRGVKVSENPVTGQITYTMKAGSQKPRVKPKEMITDAEVEDLQGVGDFTLMKAMDDAGETVEGSDVGKILDDLIRADAAKGASKVDEVAELADSRRNTRSNAEKHEPGGHGAPPKKGSSDTLAPDEDSSAPFAVRDISFGWLRDPERVLTTSDDPSMNIYAVLTAAEYSQHRTRAMIANIITRHAPNVRRGTAASERIGRVLSNQFTDEAGAIIQLTDEEKQAAVVVKTLMDQLAEQAGIAKSDNVQDYFSALLQPTTGKKRRIPPELLDTPVSGGNVFYSHMLPSKRGRTRPKKSYDIVEAFRLFERAANREVHIEPALKRAKEIADELELPSARRRYLNTLADRMRGKPTRYGRLWEEAATNALENTGMLRVAEKFGIDIDNPLTRTAGAITRGFYRGLLGGSVGFVVKNMTQSINTVADVGALNTLYGLSRMLTPSGNRAVREQELIRDFNNIFEDARFFETGLDSRNKVIRAGAKVIDSVDDIIFKPVHFSEHVNRGIAFHAGVAAEARKLGVDPNIVFGAKVDDLEKLSDNVIALLAAGHTVAQRTQFVYGTLGRSPVFQTPLGRLSGQFMTYPIKQSEFLAETARRDPLGFVRWIAITGHWSRVLNDAGVDPTGFIGAGFMPQGVEKGVPVVLSPAFSSVYHVMRLSHSLARGDLPAAERDWNTVKKDMAHLMVPAALQVERTMRFLDQYETYESTDPVTGALRRKLSGMEQFLSLIGIPSRESRISRDLAEDIFKSQKREQFQRSNIISSMLDYVEERDKRVAAGDTVPHLSHDDYYQRLVGQARAWGLPISSEQLNNAATSRELSTYLRRVLRDKKLAVEYWNRYLLAIPEEAKELGLEPIQPRNQ